MAKVLLVINCFNRFKLYFPAWWQHIEAMVVKPYRDMLDVAIYDDGSNEPGMVQYLNELKQAGRIDWLTLGPKRNTKVPLARHAFGNIGYAYSLGGWPEHEFLLHFDTDIWFIKPDLDKGFDWLNAFIDKLEEDPRVFGTSLWGCLWSSGASYKDDKPPSWFHLQWDDPAWIMSTFFSTRMFLARSEELKMANKAALTEIGKLGETRNNRKQLVGKIDSYERLVNKNEIYGKKKTVAFLRQEFGVVTRHIDQPKHLAWAKRRLGIRDEAKIERIR